MNVSRETQQSLLRYQALAERWNSKINLVAPSTLPDFFERHIVDCLQISQSICDPRGHWVDLGSGGGLPGIIMALLYKNAPVRFTLIESDSRKSAFLRTVIRELGLSHASILAERIESAEPQQADIISARALAPLPLLLSYVHRHGKPDGISLLMKGRSWKDEIDAASPHWRFQVDAIPSKTDPEAAILKVSGVTHG
ncbi:MAG: 16S rRNA (guanine(527)-N(7))-methyltransferase RsmG [Paracoccus sp. (in: a-proteobacteria)]